VANALAASRAKAMTPNQNQPIGIDKKGNLPPYIETKKHRLTFFFVSSVVFLSGCFSVWDCVVVVGVVVLMAVLLSDCSSSSSSS
jgi:hypothetical protein